MGYKVLVVDDEREALNRLLHLEKFLELETIATCDNGKEALKSINTQSPHIVFMDIKMLELNGIEVVQQCNPPYPYFIFVTTYNTYAI